MWVSVKEESVHSDFGKIHLNGLTIEQLPEYQDKQLPVNFSSESLV